MLLGRSFFRRQGKGKEFHYTLNALPLTLVLMKRGVILNT